MGLKSIAQFASSDLGSRVMKAEFVSLHALSIICPKPKLTQLSKDEASKSVGILAQEHFP